MKTIKKILKPFTLLFISLFIIHLSLIAQTGSIKGVVKDSKTNQPIWNVSVYIEQGGSLIGNVTDLDGKYTIKPLKPGVYAVKAKFQGYAPVEIQKINITSDKIVYVDFAMEQTAENIPEWKVISYKIPLISKDEPNVEYILSDQLNHDPNIHNPIAVVTEIAGITLAPNGKDVYIRGARPTSTQFIVDGVKSLTGEIGIPGQAIGSIKVYTGGIPAQYGDVSGGVIVVETKSYFDLAQEYK